jgi:DNA repair protein RadC
MSSSIFRPFARVNAGGGLANARHSPPPRPGSRRLPFLGTRAVATRQVLEPLRAAILAPRPDWHTGCRVGGMTLSRKADLRERALVSGVECLGDAELLALLLGTGTGGQPASSLATMLLDEAGGHAGLARLGLHGLSACRGVGTAKAARIAAGLELGRRAAFSDFARDRAVVGSFDHVVEWARPRLAGLDHEEVWLLGLDGRNGLRSARRVAQGGLHACALTARDVLRPALRDAASAIVLVHNHPSGDAGPSPEDVEMTRALAAACGVVGVPLLDHVVVARDGASSLLELGVIG